MSYSKPKVVHIIIQARMESTRLPGKVLKDLVGNMTALEWVVESCKLSRMADKVIIATPSSKDDLIESLCKEKGYLCTRKKGKTRDVLSEYLFALSMFPSDIIVRVCADSPFVDVEEIDRMVEYLIKNQLDYVTNHTAGLPLGTGAEVFTSSSLKRAGLEAHTLYELEHVTPYICQHPHLFSKDELPPVRVHHFAPNVRLALDTKEDYQFLTQLSKELSLTHPRLKPSTYDIVSYLEEHPELVAINQDILQKTFPNT